jgi:hypothetical protein
LLLAVHLISIGLKGVWNDKTGYYTDRRNKLIKQFRQLLISYSLVLTEQYGKDFAATIASDATAIYFELIPRIPYYETPLYRPIILLNSRLIAIIKAMQKNGKTAEDVVKIQAKFFQEEYRKLPAVVGRIYVSKFAGKFLNKMALQGTHEGWEAEFVRGTDSDDFDVSVVTAKCGLVEYLKSEGMTDLINYCNFSDFIMFPAMQIGLRQPSTIDQGKCVYCMKLKVETEIPENLAEII